MAYNETITPDKETTMNASTILAAGAVAIAAGVAMNVSEKIQYRRKSAQHEHSFQIGWKTFIAVHHATDDWNLAMRVADAVQAEFNPYKTN